MGLGPAIAKRVAKTKFGQRALAAPDELKLLEHRPTPRVIVGLVITGLSFFLMWPAMGICGYLAATMDEPLYLVIGAPVVLVVVHVIFGVGVYLAGSNYAKTVLLWAAKRFIRRHSPPEAE